MSKHVRDRDEPTIAVRGSIANPGYRVRLCTKPVVIDQKGDLVKDAFIITIQFPRERTTTSGGQVPVVIGPGKARILVGKVTIRGVPLC